MKRALRIRDRVKRWKGGIGPVYQGDPRCYNNNKMMAYVGSNTYAGKVVKGHTRIYINHRLAATHPGLCRKGITISGSDRLFLA
jgi:hypothetical protein